MNNYKYMIVIKGEPKDNISDCYYDPNSEKQIVTFESGKPYPYGYNIVEKLSDPEELNKGLYKFFNRQDTEFYNIEKVLLFQGKSEKYIRFFFKGGTCRSYNLKDIKIEESALLNSKSKDLINYYKLVSDVTGIKTNENINIIRQQLEKMEFIDKNTILAEYFNPKDDIYKKIKTNKPAIFPFGCNPSQIIAVNNALENAISIIEGPPGTGKTQTILNIIANIVIRGYTVAVVSNNNSATDNVFEKLQNYKFGYIAAQLGKSDNKETFIASKQPQYPDFSKDILEPNDYSKIADEIRTEGEEIRCSLDKQNKIAELMTELDLLETEKKYFENSVLIKYNDIKIFRNKSRITSERALMFWNSYQDALEEGKNIGFWFKVKSIIWNDVNGFDVFKEPPMDVINRLKRHFYEVKISEILTEIQELQESISGVNFENKLKEYVKKSNILLKSSIARKYKARKNRKVFTGEDLWKNTRDFLAEYPVILSTTYSLRTSLPNVIYDYVIIDEASQVDLLTGVLAMSCAKNIVVVGDLKQLPNVITEKDRHYISEISEKLDIRSQYRYEGNNILSSVCEVFDSAPRTLLREHYRCHPKIINFCNQKFYNNELIIMTKDNGEDDVLKVYMTAEGNHARGHFNQRQIDVVKHEVIPELNSQDVGVISPYKAQTSALIEELQKEIDISTVHKFQGREKNDIIISTVDNEITDFTDDPNLLNVAVSRAKNRLRLVVSNNENNDNTNIGDLIRYIKYNNFDIVKSDIFSVFDLLYKNYNTYRKKFLSKYKRISKYDSENLMFAIITEVLKDYSALDVVEHISLSSIIRNCDKLIQNELEYVRNDWSHVDFLIYNKLDKSIVLIVEVDGYEYHKDGTRQSERDKMKNAILEKYEIEYMRFNTTGSMEREKLKSKLDELLAK